MEGFKVTIIGAGVVGLAIAARLSEEIPSVLVVEKNASFGMETSSRNSEVIHAGIYYPPGSLKARTCVEGNRLLYQICAAGRIPYRKTGKLIVAVDSSEIPAMDKLFENAGHNNVPDISVIGADEIARFEPNIRAVAAIHSRSTGIIDSHSLMKYFISQANERGAMVAFKTRVERISRENPGFTLTVQDAQGQPMEIYSRVVINCAGLSCDTIARLAGIDIQKLDYVLHYCKGSYFKICERKSKLIHGLVYPLPHSSLVGLGVHATVNLAGSVRLGPDHEYIGRDQAAYDVDVAKRAYFFDSARKYLPFLEAADLSADTAGIRPKLQGEFEGFRDFIIRDESDLGLPGFINLIGIESPGLTACPAIAKYVRDLVFARVSSKAQRV